MEEGNKSPSAPGSLWRESGSSSPRSVYLRTRSVLGRRVAQVLTVRSQRGRWGSGRAQNGKRGIWGDLIEHWYCSVQKSLINPTFAHQCLCLSQFFMVIKAEQPVGIQARSARSKSRDCACGCRGWGTPDIWVHVLLEPISKLNTNILCVHMKRHCFMMP